MKLSLSTCLNHVINASSNMLDMCNKLFSLNFGMGNTNPSTFFGNVQWKVVVKQLKNSDLHSISILQLSVSTCFKF